MWPRPLCPEESPLTHWPGLADLGVKLHMDHVLYKEFTVIILSIVFQTSG